MKFDGDMFFEIISMQRLPFLSVGELSGDRELEKLRKKKQTRQNKQIHFNVYCEGKGISCHQLHYQHFLKLELCLNLGVKHTSSELMQNVSFKIKILK